MNTIESYFDVLLRYIRNQNGNDYYEEIDLDNDIFSDLKLPLMDGKDVSRFLAPLIISVESLIKSENYKVKIAPANFSLSNRGKPRPHAPSTESVLVDLNTYLTRLKEIRSYYAEQEIIDKMITIDPKKVARDTILTVKEVALLIWIMDNSKFTVLKSDMDYADVCQHLFGVNKQGIRRALGEIKNVKENNSTYLNVKKHLLEMIETIDAKLQ